MTHRNRARASASDQLMSQGLLPLSKRITVLGPGPERARLEGPLQRGLGIADAHCPCKNDTDAAYERGHCSGPDGGTDDTVSRSLRRPAYAPIFEQLVAGEWCACIRTADDYRGDACSGLG